VEKDVKNIKNAKSNKVKFKTIKTAKPSAKKVSSKGSGEVVPFIRIERHVQHIGKGGSFYRTHFKDFDGNAQHVNIPREYSSLESVKVLLREGAKLPKTRDDQKLCFEDAVENMGSQPTLKITDRVGWSNVDGTGTSFVYYEKTFGPAREKLQLDDDSNRNSALGKKGGTLEKWRDGLEEPCRFSDHLVMAIGIAASGPLYDIIGNPEPAIYHFQGARKPPGDNRVWQSSSAKTLCARGGQSTFAACSRTDLFGFNMTQLALEETCFSCNNLLVVLDEQGTASEGGGSTMIKPNDLPYRIVGGQGKRRSKHYSTSQGLSNRSWVVPVITTAEDQLDPGKSKRREGAQVRMVPIPFPPTWKGGTFCNAAKSERKRLKKLIWTTTEVNYGVAMPRFVTHLVKDRPTLGADILEIRDGFVKDVVATHNDWEDRYAEKFGIVLAAALLLVRYGIAPWTEERATTAITNLYNAARSLSVSVPQATDALLTRLRKEVAAKKHFPKVSKGETLTKAQKKEFWGCVKEIGGKKNITAVPMTRLRKLVQTAAVADQVLDELASRNLLMKAPDGHLTRQLEITGLSDKRRRYVCIKGLVARSE
jgi:hypothetical protein